MNEELTPPSMSGPAARRRRLSIDVLLGAVLLAASGLWATTYWNTWIAKGGQPEFYQNYFEPAVMVACGHGFVISQEGQPKPLEDFLQRRSDTFDCATLPAGLKLGRENIYQGAWIYLVTTVGWWWRLMGVSWNGMGPLFGLFFGVSVALAYGVFRLGTAPTVATLCAIGVTTSAAHLLNLPNLRDYAKAPFTLALVFILGLIVTLPVRRLTLLLLAAAYGTVLGVGYGFRTDFLVNVPALLIVLFLFLECGVRRQLLLKVAATAVFLTTFIVTSYPVLTAVYEKGGCQWHVALLGLQSPFDELLHVAPAPYDFGYAYSDGYIDQTIRGYARRVNPGLERLAFCSHEYDVESGNYLKAIVTSLPADMIIRGYGSALQIADLPFLWWDTPMRGWLDPFYAARTRILRPLIGAGPFVLGVGLLLVSSASIRLGFFAWFVVLYFGGYPAIQFQTRHHFHLEFITWWAAGFTLQQLASVVGRVFHARAWLEAPRRAAGRVAVVTLTAAVTLVGLLGIARSYQQRRATELFEGYIAAPTSPLALPGGELPRTETTWPQFVEVRLNEAACGPNPAVTFRYNVTPADGDLSRTFAIDRPSPVPGVTRFYLPVFQLFKGVEVSDDRPGCVLGASRVTDLTQFPLLLGAVLPPDWKSLPLHQRLGDWETGPRLVK